MKPRLMGLLQFKKSSDATTFENFLTTLIDRIDVKDEKSVVSREGNIVNFNLIFENMTQIQRLRTWAKDHNLKRKLKTALIDDDKSSLIFHQCVHEDGELCGNASVLI